MTADVQRAIRRWGYRLHLIRYCLQCDGSINEARERGRPFAADRWVLHRKHERHAPLPGKEQGRMRTDLPRRPLPEAWL